MNELLVCADLMDRGYHVFRAMSQSSPCDLIAYRAGQSPVRIEVKTLNGTIAGIKVDEERSDVLVTVSGRTVRYYATATKQELVEP